MEEWRESLTREEADRMRFWALLACARRVGCVELPVELRQVLYHWLTVKQCRRCRRWSDDRERAALEYVVCRCCQRMVGCGLPGCTGRVVACVVCAGCDETYCPECAHFTYCALCAQPYCTACNEDWLPGYCDECEASVCYDCGHDECAHKRCKQMLCCTSTRCELCHKEFCVPFHAHHHAPCHNPAVKRKK